MSAASAKAFHKLKVAEVARETADAVSVRFEVPEALKGLFAFRAGQHLTLLREIDGEEVRRNYSVCVGPDEGELRIAIKRIPGGAFSSWANSDLAVGHVVDVMPPHGGFTRAFDPAGAHSYVAFAGGSGITPILSLMKAALSGEPDSRFTLVYGNRSSAAIMFLETLAGLKDRYLDRLSIFHVLEDEEEEIELFNGRLDAAKVETLLSGPIDPTTVDAFFICGPGPMMDAVEAGLTARGVAPEKIMIERFTAGRPSAADAARVETLEKQALGARMSVTLDGRRLRLEFDPAKGAILDNIRAAGLPAPFACKGGVCATCRARLTQGSVEMKVNYGLTAEEVAAGYILTCQAIPTSAELALSYDG